MFKIQKEKDFTNNKILLFYHKSLFINDVYYAINS